mgnify:CR=1 FL=1
MQGFTNTRESGLEALIVKYLIEQNGYEEGNNTEARLPGLSSLSVPGLSAHRGC